MLFALRREKTCVPWFAIKKDTDQSAQGLHNQISAFVSRLLKSSISKLATSEFSLFYLVSVAEQAGWSMT